MLLVFEGKVFAPASTHKHQGICGTLGILDLQTHPDWAHVALGSFLENIQMPTLPLPGLRPKLQA